MSEATHLGVSWKFRHTRNLETALVHAVERPEGVVAERLPDGRMSWSKPWLRVCDGGPAFERRLGWATDATCPRCLRKLAKPKWTYVHGYLARQSLFKAIAAYDDAGLPTTDEVRGNLITAALQLAPFREPPEGYEDDESADGPEDWFGVL